MVARSCDPAPVTVILLAIAAALAAAVSFGVAAVNQHGAVRRSVSGPERQLAVGQLGALLRDPAWLRGFALMALGTLFHVAALGLAPISLTQPINVLAVPTTIVVTAAITRQRPRPLAIVAASGVVLGVGGVVFSLRDAAPGTLPQPLSLALVGATTVTATIVLHLIARYLIRRDRSASERRAPTSVQASSARATSARPTSVSTTSALPVSALLGSALLALAAAGNFAVTSSTYRLIAQDLTGSQHLPTAVLIALIGYAPISLSAGSWSLQQAYAAGAAPSVTATSALADPVVAVLIGVTVFAELPPLGVARAALLAVAGVVAIGGVIGLVRHDRMSIHPSPTQSSPAHSPPAHSSATHSSPIEKDQRCTSCSPPTSTPSSTTEPERPPSVSRAASPPAATR